MKKNSTTTTTQENHINSMDISSIWQFQDDYSVYDAAALLAGYEPSQIEKYRNNDHLLEYFPHYPATIKNLTTAILNNKLAATLRYPTREYGYEDAMSDDVFMAEHRGCFYGTSAEADEEFTESLDRKYFVRKIPCWELSTIHRETLIHWLSSRGIKTGFFFSEKNPHLPPYLDEKHPRFSPKLAAVITAWLAMEDRELLKGKSPKQALLTYLKLNAPRFKLSDEDGRPNETGIEECAKVANWQDKGGAPKTLS